MENFISPEKSKIMSRLFLDCQEEQWKFQRLLPSGANEVSNVCSGLQEAY